MVLQVWQKATKKLNCACVTFLCMILLRNKTLAHTFLPSFDNANGSLSWKTVEIQRFCSYGNLTAYFSFLLNTLVEEVDRKGEKGLSPSHRPFRRGAVPFSCDRSVTAYEKDKRRLRTSQQVALSVRMWHSNSLNKKNNLVLVNLCVLI